MTDETNKAHSHSNTVHSKNRKNVMANKTEDKPNATENLSNPTVSDKQSSSTPSAHAPTKATAAWPGYLALALSLGALGVSGMLYSNASSTSQDLRQSLASQAANIESRLASQKSEVAQTVAAISDQSASINERLGSQSTQIQNIQADREDLHTRITQALQQVQSEQIISERDWLIAEAEYLLRLANQRIIMEQNTLGALALLRAADEILVRANDTSLFQVRRDLASDIAQLVAVPAVDVEGLFLQLSVLNDDIPKLRTQPVSDRINNPNVLDSISPELLSEDIKEGAKSAFSSALSKLDQLVVITQRDEPVEPLMSPEQLYYLQQNLHLTLEQAQHALLQRKQQSFDTSLEKAINWINTYFETDDSLTQSILTRLEEIKNQNINPEVPAVSAALNSLQAHSNEIRRLKREGGQS